MDNSFEADRERNFAGRAGLDRRRTPIACAPVQQPYGRIFCRLSGDRIIGRKGASTTSSWLFGRRPVGPRWPRRRAGNASEIPSQGWKDILRRVYQGISDDRILANAAGVTFYALLALFPAIAALVSIYALLADPTPDLWHPKPHGRYA